MHLILVSYKPSWKGTHVSVVGSVPNEVIEFFSTDQPHYGPGVDSASNRSEYQDFAGE
jgi:hypothetical protein